VPRGAPCRLELRGLVSVLKLRSRPCPRILESVQACNNARKNQTILADNPTRGLREKLLSKLLSLTSGPEDSYWLSTRIALRLLPQTFYNRLRTQTNYMRFEFNL